VPNILSQRLGGTETDALPQDCGFRLYNYGKFVSVPVANLAGFQFQPTMHIWCKHANMDTMEQFKDDGLPKFEENPQ